MKEKTTFDRFWEQYPRKVGKGKCQMIWSRLKMSEELLKTILGAISAQKQSLQWTRDHGQFIPHPSTWLAQKRWEDEPDNFGDAAAPQKPLPSAADIRRVIRENRDRLVGVASDKALERWDHIFEREFHCSYQEAMKAFGDETF